MAAITITTQPVAEVVAGGGTPSDLTVVATYDGEETLLYQWQSCSTAAGGTIADIDGETTDTFTPDNSPVGVTKYYRCELSATDVAEPVYSAIVGVGQNGLLPDFPEDGYFTGAYVLDYIAQCSKETQDFFAQECARTGIGFPDNGNALRTAQIELFMRCI